MRTGRFLIGLVCLPDDAGWWRVALDGRGFGPWMDHESAEFAKRWLIASHDGLEEVLKYSRVEMSFEQAIGIRPRKVAQAAEPKALNGSTASHGPETGDG